MKALEARPIGVAQPQQLRQPERARVAD